MHFVVHMYSIIQCFFSKLLTCISLKLQPKWVFLSAACKMLLPYPLSKINKKNGKIKQQCDVHTNINNTLSSLDFLSSSKTVFNSVL